MDTLKQEHQSEVAVLRAESEAKVRGEVFICYIQNCIFSSKADQIAIHKIEAIETNHT